MTVAPTNKNRPREGKTFEARWEGLSSADGVGGPVAGPGQADRCVHVYGTWDGAGVRMKGSCKDFPDNGGNIHNAFGDDLILTEPDAMGAFAENPYWFWPEVINPGASTNLTVIVISRSTVT